MDIIDNDIIPAGDEEYARKVISEVDDLYNKSYLPMAQYYSKFGNHTKVSITLGQSTAKYEVDNQIYRDAWKRTALQRTFFNNAVEPYERLTDSLSYDEDLDKDLRGDLTDSWYKVQEMQAFVQNSRDRWVIKKEEPEKDYEIPNPLVRSKKKKNKLRKSIFLKQVRHDISIVARTLRKDKTGLGQKIITFVRCFYKTAKKVAVKTNKEFISLGFIFGYSHSKFCQELDITKSVLGRILNLAAGLGLIYKISPVEAKGIGEFWHKKFSVGMLQFKLLPLKPKIILRNWKLWQQSGLRLKTLTIRKLEQLFNRKLNTHPEARDKKLRQVIAAANKQAEQERKELLRKKKQIVEDPFGTGQKGKVYRCDIRRRYTLGNAKQILERVVMDHNRYSYKIWTSLADTVRKQKYCVVTVKVKTQGRYIRWLRRPLVFFKQELLIEEDKILCIRKQNRKLIYELFDQGLVGFITKTETLKGCHSFSKTEKLRYFQVVRQNRVIVPQRKKVPEKISLLPTVQDYELLKQTG